MSSFLVECLLAHNHSVSTFQRTSKGRVGVDEILVDISEPEKVMEVIRGKVWDYVVDVDPTVQPDVVRNLVCSLKQCNIKHYTFISSIGVYKDFSQVVTEDSPLAAIPEGKVELSGATFGGLKVGNESAVIEEMGKEHSLIIRPGLIIGPHDGSGRFAYWVNRFLHESKDPVAAPDSAKWPTQAIDVRDLAAWVVSMMETNETGVYNAVIDYKFGEIIEGLQTIASEAKRIVWIPHSQLLEANIKPYMQLPLWVPPSMIGLVTADCNKATQKALQARPISETVKNTAEWLKTLTEDEKLALISRFYSAIGNVEVGLSSTLEQELISAVST
mgnify:CR=1 FL=1